VESLIVSCNCATASNLVLFFISSSDGAGDPSATLSSVGVGKGESVCYLP
jgi:hypothetical protein